MLIIQAQHASSRRTSANARAIDISAAMDRVIDLQGSVAQSASPVQTRGKGGETRAQRLAIAAARSGSADGNKAAAVYRASASS